MSRLELNFNCIDGRWRVTQNNITICDGASPEEAIASARMVTDEPIYQLNGKLRYEVVS